VIITERINAPTATPATRRGSEDTASLTEIPRTLSTAADADSDMVIEGLAELDAERDVENSVADGNWLADTDGRFDIDGDRDRVFERDCDRVEIIERDMLALFLEGVKDALSDKDALWELLSDADTLWEPLTDDDALREADALVLCMRVNAKSDKKHHNWENLHVQRTDDALSDIVCEGLTFAVRDQVTYVSFSVDEPVRLLVNV